MTLAEVLKVVEESMVASCNFYAPEDMGKSAAIHDAFLCLKQALEKEFDK